MSEDLSSRLNCPYLIGVYLAINAIPDAYLLVDGPNCLFHKAEYIHGRHDLHSTLFNCSGYHRVQFTGTNSEKVATNYESAVAGDIQKIASLSHCKGIFLSSISFCKIVGIQYDRLIREIPGDLGKPVWEVAGYSLEGDWLDGYARTLHCLASSIDLKRGSPKPENVAIVGYLMDRTEADHQGNIAELRRMLEGISLKPVSIWLSNSPLGHLQKIKNAATVISLPHGREAASTIAERIGARVINTSFPFGIARTQEWIRQVAGALGKRPEAEAFIQRETEQIIPKLEWLVPHVFLNRRLVWIGEPYLLGGLMSLAEDLGFRIAGAYLAASQRHLDKETVKMFKEKARIIFEPTRRKLNAEWKLHKKNGVDLVIGNSRGLSMIDSDAAQMEFGYPCYHYHALQQEPYLGFRGSISFIHRMVNAIMGSSMFKGR